MNLRTRKTPINSAANHAETNASNVSAHSEFEIQTTSPETQTLRPAEQPRRQNGPMGGRVAAPGVTVPPAIASLTQPSSSETSSSTPATSFTGLADEERANLEAFLFGKPAAQQADNGHNCTHAHEHSHIHTHGTHVHGSAHIHVKDQAAAHNHGHEHGCGNTAAGQFLFKSLLALGVSGAALVALQKLGLIDMDEAAHALESAAGNVRVILQKGFSNLIEQLNKEAAELTNDTWQAIANSVVPKGKLGFGMSLGIAVPTVGFGALAAKAGWGEKEEATHEEQPEIDDLRKNLLSELADLRVLLNPTSNAEQLAQAKAGVTDRMLRAKVVQKQQNLNDVELANSQNHLAKHFGWGGFLSGASIGIGLALKAIEQIGLKLGAGGIDQIAELVKTQAAAKHSATVVGFLNTMLTSPGAAVGAVYLGVAATRKAGEKRAQIKQDAATTDRYLADVNKALQDDTLKARATTWGKAAAEMAGKVQGYFSWYQPANKVFLASTPLYLTSVYTKSAVVVASLVGLGKYVANPATLGIPTAVGLVGGLGMLAGSWQFLTGHGKQHELDHSFLGSHLKLDRDFLSSLDVMLPTSDESDDETVGAGAQLRAHLYDALQQNEDRRVKFMQQIAIRASQPDDSVDLEANDTTQSTQTSQTKGTLNAETLTAWLEKTSNWPVQIEYMVDQLSRHQNYTEHKISLRNQVFPSGPEIELVASELQMAELPANAQDAHKGMEALTRFLSSQVKSSRRDQEISGQTTLLCDDLTKLKKELLQPENQDFNAEELSSLMALFRERFVCLQTGARYDVAKREVNAEASLEQYTHFLNNEAPEQHKNLRNLLLETELQASRIRKLAAEFV
jgi:hypothetical protein